MHGKYLRGENRVRGLAREFMLLVSVCFVGGCLGGCVTRSVLLCANMCECGFVCVARCARNPEQGVLFYD